MNIPLLIRADDVLQTSLFTKTQRVALQDKSMFEWFLDIDKEFEKYNYPMILAVLSEGIDTEHEWVEHIKKNKHRYIIELHGGQHLKYGRLSREDLFNDLYWSKLKIEKAFNVKVSTWYVPFGRKGRNAYAEEVCKALEINLGIPDRKVDAKLWFNDKALEHVNFHYWREDQNNHVKEILKQLCQKEK